MSTPNGSAPLPPNQATFPVLLPLGQTMHLQSPEEVALWDSAKKRYIDDYHFSNVNDLNLLGAILQQIVTQFRAQRVLNGMEPVLDNSGVPTGQYAQVKLDADDTATYQKVLNTATGQIQSLEKTLGIDKVSREAGGQVSIANYLRTLKKAAHERGIHIVERTMWVERFIMELSTMMRMLKNLDAEDRSYHGLTDEKMLDWVWEKVQEFHAKDQQWHQQKGKLYAGQL